MLRNSLGCLSPHRRAPAAAAHGPAASSLARPLSQRLTTNQFAEFIPAGLGGGVGRTQEGSFVRLPTSPPQNPLSPPLTHPRTLHPSDGSYAGASFRQLGGTSLVSTLVFGVPQSSTGRISAVPKGRVLCLGPTPIGASWESGLTSPSFSRERPGNLGRPGPEPHANGPHISPRLVTSSLE